MMIHDADRRSTAAQREAAKTDADALFASLRRHRSVRYVGCVDASSGSDARPDLGDGFDLLCRAMIDFSCDPEIAPRATVDAGEDREACRRELEESAARLVRNPYSQLIVVWSMVDEHRVQIVRGGGVPAERPIPESIRWLALQWRFEFEKSFEFFFEDLFPDDHE